MLALMISFCADISSHRLTCPVQVAPNAPGQCGIATTAPGTDMPSHSLQTASLARRLVAAFYDSLLIIALWFLATAALLPITGGKELNSENPFYLIYLITITSLFFFWFWHRNGQTLGMQAWRIQLVDTRGVKPAIKQILQRVALLMALLLIGLYGLTFLALEQWPDWVGMVCLAPLGLSMAWSLVDRESRCLHDIATATRFILRPKPVKQR